METIAFVSIVVPTYNNQRTIERCLQSILADSDSSTEIIVVDNFSTDSTDQLANSAGVRVIKKGNERSAQRNAGFEASRGKIVLFIDSDMYFTPGIIEEVRTAFQNTDTHAVVIPERNVTYGFWSRCKALERSYYNGVWWMEAARAYRSNTIKSVGAFDERNTGTEDYDLSMRVIKTHGRSSVSRIHTIIEHDEGDLRFWRNCKKKYYYGKSVAQYISQGNQQLLSKQSSLLQRYLLFFSRPREAIRHPIEFIGMLLLKAAEMLCAGIGAAVSIVNRTYDKSSAT